MLVGATQKEMYSDLITILILDIFLHMIHVGFPSTFSYLLA